MVVISDRCVGIAIQSRRVDQSTRKDHSCNDGCALCKQIEYQNVQSLEHDFGNLCFSRIAFSEGPFL